VIYNILMYIDVFSDVKECGEFAHEKKKNCILLERNRNMVSSVSYVEKDEGIRGISVHSLRKRLSCRGFSFIELVLALLIISIVMASSSTMIETMADGKRYRDTVDELAFLARHYVGDPQQLQTGHQASFAYFGMYNQFPNMAAIDDVFEITAEPMSTRKETVTGENEFRLENGLVDEWGSWYTYDLEPVGNLPPFLPAHRVKFISPGTNRIGGDADDVEFNFTRFVYERNHVRFVIKDAKGTILRARNNDQSFPGYLEELPSHIAFSIYTVALVGTGTGASQQVFGYASNLNPGTVVGVQQLLYEDGLFTARFIDGTAEGNGWDNEGVRAGIKVIVVTPVEEPDPVLAGTHGKFNVKGDLIGWEGEAPQNDENTIRKYIVVYPLGPNVIQHYEVRLPGVLDDNSVGDKDDGE